MLWPTAFQLMNSASVKDMKRKCNWLLKNAGIKPEQIEVDSDK